MLMPLFVQCERFKSKENKTIRQYELYACVSEIFKKVFFLLVMFLEFLFLAVFGYLGHFPRSILPIYKENKWIISKP